MGNLKGVDIQRGNIGVSVLGNTDAICALLCNGIAVDASDNITGIKIGETIKLTSVNDLVALGIDEQYDIDNNVFVYRHVSEFFRIAGGGNTLYLMLYTGTPSDAFDTIYGKKLLADAKGEIRVLAVSYTPDSEGDSVNGLDSEVYAALTEAQLFYDWAFDTSKPCQIVLEGRGFSAANAVSALNLREIEDTSGNVLQLHKVSLCIGQDYNYAETRGTSVLQKMADIGTMLGSVALRSVAQNIGAVSGGDIMNAVSGKWALAGLSNHEQISDWDEQLELLDDKGYVFPIIYAGFSGYFWNNDHTCTPIVKDKDGYMNEFTISYGRVMDKCIRSLRTELLPQVKSTQPVDVGTGKLPQAVVKYFEALGDDVFGKMAGTDISYGKTTVDANSDLTVIPRELKVSFVVVPMGQIDVIKGTINLKASV